MSVASVFLTSAVVSLCVTAFLMIYYWDGQESQRDRNWRSLDDVARYYKERREFNARRVKLIFLFSLLTFLLFASSIIIGVVSMLA